jgi:hypothetical protein
MWLIVTLTFATQVEQQAENQLDPHFDSSSGRYFLFE